MTRSLTSPHRTSAVPTIPGHLVPALWRAVGVRLAIPQAWRVGSLGWNATSLHSTRALVAVANFRVKNGAEKTGNRAWRDDDPRSCGHDADYPPSLLALSRNIPML